MSVEQPQIQPQPSEAARPPLPQGQVYDETGRVICKFPPFPIPPAGAQIVSFNDFMPSGIQVRFGDEPEKDGMGVPTARLEKQHDNESAPKKKKKGTKTMITGENIARQTTWWEDWEAGEPQRIRTARKIDQNAHQLDRLALSVEEFVRLHPLQDDQELLKWWEKFQKFLGLTEVKIKPKVRRNIRHLDVLEDEDDDDDELEFDDDVETKESRDVPAPKAELYEEKLQQIPAQNMLESDESFAERVRREKAKREFMSQTFLDDAQFAIKVFFSTYFFELGLFAEPKACQRLPRLVNFFLSFTVATRALVQHEESLKFAIRVAQQAVTQLPLTGHIGIHIPDKLGKCLKEVFGAQAEAQAWGSTPISDEVKEESPVADLAEKSTDDKDTDEGPDDNANSWANVDNGDDGGWGRAEGGDAWGNASGAWSMDIDTAESNSGSWWMSEKHNLMELLGPTTLPISHVVGYVEESTRSITKITMPTAAGSAPTTKTPKGRDSLEAFAKIELKPYEHFPGPSEPYATIREPKLLKDPHALFATNDKVEAEDNMTSKAPKHDPLKDTITILADPSWVVNEMKNSIGIGLRGVFVQVIPNTDSSAQSGSAKGRSKKDKDEKTVFWYAEKLHQSIPSFWTELGPYEKLFRYDMDVD